MKSVVFCFKTQISPWWNLIFTSSIKSEFDKPELSLLKSDYSNLRGRVLFQYLIVLPLILGLSIFTSVSAQVSGTVFKDFNGNGVKDNTASFNEIGMEGVTVSAVNPAGTALTVSYTGGGASTNSTGGYAVTGGTLGQIRLEFILPDAYTFASNGAAGGTTVMFPTSATQNLAVNYPSDYAQPSPQLIVPCYSSGTLTGGGATNPAMVKFGYTGYDKYIGQGGYIPPTEITEHQFIGPVWGLAYARAAKKVYAGALFRRHVVLGPQGVGGIYEINPTSGVVTNWLDIETLAGVDAGMDTRDGTPANSIPPDPNDKSYDVNAFPLAGKNALGDVEISDDESVIYVTNLFQQSLVAINRSTKALIGSYNITPSGLGLSCPPGDLRPWGLKYHNGKVYVGVVCTAENSQNVADLKGYVLEFDPASPGAGFSIYFSFSFDYLREQEPETHWNPWNLNSYIPGNGAEDNNNPQPIVSDIEFDVDGSLIMGIMDRHGLMFASFNYPPDPTASETNRANPETNGDILRACITSSGLALEGATGCSYNFTYSGGTVGEFYNDRRQGGLGNGNPRETAQGALAFLPGNGEVVSTSVDEYDAQENGICWWNNTTGVRNRAYMVFDNTIGGTLGKASGLGDIELLLDPAPLEIGNRVWMDTDNDGVQDAGEMGIGSVIVKLYLGATQVGQTTTASDGTYYFNNSTVNLNGATGLLPNTAYIIRVDAVDFPSGKSLSTFQNVGGAGQPDVRDNDAALNAGNAEITVTTGDYGENDHTLDMAFFVCTAPTATFSQTAPTCTGATANNNGIITFATATGVTNFGISTAGAATYDGPAYPATTFTTVGQNVSTTIPNTGGTYIVRVFNGNAGCFTDVTVTVAAVTCATVCTSPVLTTTPGNLCVGNLLALNTLVAGNTPAGTLTFHTSAADATAGTNAILNTIVSPAAATTYYIRSTISSICFSTGSVTVSVNTAPALTVVNGSVCSGGNINLATLVTATGGGSLTYHSSQAAAQAGTGAFASGTVSLITATNYYVRSTNSNGCFTVREITVNISPIACGTIQVSGPN